MAAYRRVYGFDHLITYGLTAQDRDQLRNSTLVRAWNYLCPFLPALHQALKQVPTSEIHL